MTTARPRFITTPWTIVMAAANQSSPEAARALETLCGLYWYPVYGYVRRRGASPQDAEDLTQEFFSRLLEKEFLDGVAPENGRFRTFLLVCLRRVLANEQDRAAAQKRGGGRPVLSIDMSGAEDRYRLEPADPLTPERVFERRWALTVLENVLVRLEADWGSAGKGRQFESLKVYLAADQHAPPYAEAADRLGMTEGAVKVAVHRMRQQFGRLVREEIGRTVSDPAEVEEEIRALFEALSQ